MSTSSLQSPRAGQPEFGAAQAPHAALHCRDGGAGPSGSRAVVPAAGGGRGGRGRGGRGGADQPPKKAGAGTKMLEGMKQKGQPITPKMQEMADWLDGLEAGADGAGGEVRICVLDPLKGRVVEWRPRHEVTETPPKPTRVSANAQRRAGTHSAGSWQLAKATISVILSCIGQHISGLSGCRCRW